MVRMKYPKIIHFGEPITEFFKQGDLHIEEKIDGSQFRIFVDKNEILCGSKSVNYSDEVPPDKMFESAVEKANEIFGKSKLRDTNIFCEFLMKPKHNTMNYSRTPKNNLIVFDVSVGGQFLSFDDKMNFADNFGLEVAPMIWQGNGKDLTMTIIEKLLTRDSVLGREKIEGMVFKNYSKMWQEGYQAGKLIMLKFVKEEFKERNIKEWKTEAKTGFLEKLIGDLKTEARYNKAIQHLKEQGKLTNSPKDIGLLAKEIVDDTEKEEADYIKEELFKFFWRKEIRKGLIKGFPEWYKKRLLEEGLNEAQSGG